MFIAVVLVISSFYYTGSLGGRVGPGEQEVAGSNSAEETCRVSFSQALGRVTK